MAEFPDRHASPTPGQSAMSPWLVTTLLILHALVGVALLGGITHQAVSLLRARPDRNGNFLQRYAGVSPPPFTTAVIALYVTNMVLGALLYPSYRLNVRIPFEEMSLGWAIGLFELKEHFAGIGLGALPFYAYTWRPDSHAAHRRDRLGITLLLGVIVWWDFVVGHVLNNLRGLG